MSTEREIHEQKLEAKRQLRERVKNSGIRMIDQGTIYDVEGKLTKISRQVRDGAFGDVNNAIVILRYTPGQGLPRKVQAFSFGSGSEADILLMLESVKKVLY